MLNVIPEVPERIIRNEMVSQDLFKYNFDATFMIDLDGKFVALNSATTGLFGYSFEELRQMQISNILLPEEKDRLFRYFENSRYHAQWFETVIRQKQGSLLDVEMVVFSIIANNHFIGIYAIARDIRDGKMLKEQYKRISFHDSMTGLYNRTYFELEMQRLENEQRSSIGLILCDVDGLKSVNDTLGPDQGDALLLTVSNVLKASTDQKDLVARIGGDEFAVIVDQGDLSKMELVYNRICEALNDYNIQTPELPISLSMGWGFSPENRNSLTELYKEAEDNMYREKLLHSRSMCGSFVAALMKALESHDYISEQHSDRVQKSVTLMGTALALPNHQIADLRMLAKIHDIGKIGISDRILQKAGPLTPQEYKEIQRHSEIGQKIIELVSPLKPIAGYILKHHEWWNGKGYPLGIKGEEIPVECRILSIADAYDAMTNDRPYRMALSRVEAMVELKRGKGIQFDPKLVDLYLEIIKKREFKV
ncbi:bifunctional diguanylate cyclase/phosphohydrolase [Desulfosporosinus youngiae]|uniref:PAS domain S-box/diguanylate cyclase (GGDEF) domain-containing protein n=1 Tax=Desulfosporosinus youngiae DSM 17734 TaxID=768710 RepID=H5Y5T3_9FIRM|nr:HD domain-containing phosphohydrolase [Desulfosporosinus youngiae]EHQ90809.1 PAS domain S-box/diguanylate cyclase (GGDEF) domain-containing protein [Desulfosporosinus youngiae DSM 17734]